MKIRIVEKPLREVLRLPRPARRKPVRPMLAFRILLKILSLPSLWAARFTCRKIGMERLAPGEPCLILMNHSCFIDLKIAASVLFPRAFNIVCTSDGFVGKGWLMRLIGCIPTRKFVPDMALVRDMLTALHERRSSVLLFPEAGYSFDGTATVLPDSLGKSLKLLKVPVVMLRTYGAFARDPLYNGLQLRRVRVSADLEYLLSPEEIAAKTVAELNALIRERFSFDNFRWQQQNEVRVREPFRADGLNRVLYKCPHCHTEGKMVGAGESLSCGACGTRYTLTELGYLMCENQQTVFSHVPDWFAWQRECVRRELERGEYALDVPVEVCALVDEKCLYRVGEGRLRHSAEGFRLTGCDGELDITQKPQAAYSLNADYYWYEIGDVICLGDDVLYYCFPRVAGDIVAKARLATEELYKLARAPRG